MHVSVAPPGVVNARLTVDVSPLTVLPDASCTVTVGCVPKAAPAVAVPLGCVVIVSLVAAPAESVIALLSGVAVSPAAVAVKVSL